MTTKEVARLLDMSTTWVRKLADDGVIPCRIRRVDGEQTSYHWDRDAIDAYMKAGGYVRTRHRRSIPPEYPTTSLLVATPERAAPPDDPVVLRAELDRLRTLLEKETAGRAVAEAKIDELYRLLRSRTAMVRAALDSDPTLTDLLGPSPE